MLKKIIVFGICSMLWCSCSQKERITDLEIKFERALSLKDAPTAIGYLHDIIDLEPENISAYARLSKLYIASENFEGALIAADKATPKANSIELKKLLRYKSKAYKKMKEPLKAIEVLDSLISIDSESKIEYTFDKGTLYFESNQPKKSIETMRAIAENPKSSQVIKEISSNYGNETVSYKNAALNYIGALYMAGNKLDSAKITYERILNETQSFKLANNNYVILTQKLLALEQ